MWNLYEEIYKTVFKNINLDINKLKNILCPGMEWLNVLKYQLLENCYSNIISIWIPNFY